MYDHILHMSDALADGIVKQFPEKFGAGMTSTSGKRQRLHGGVFKTPTGVDG